MYQLQDNLHHHPVIAFVISVCSIVLGMYFHILGSLSNKHIPPIVIETLMCMSYCFGIVVGGITVYTFVKKLWK